MKLRLLLPALLLTALSPASPAPAGNTTAVAGGEGGNFETTRARIEQLFLGRDAPPVVPLDIINPFSPAAVRLAGQRGSETTPHRSQVLSDHELLQRVAPSIPVRGIVQTGGRRAVVIDKRPFSVGNRLTVQYGDELIVIVVKQITDETYTLGYRKAEMTLRLAR